MNTIRSFLTKESEIFVPLSKLIDNKFVQSETLGQPYNVGTMLKHNSNLSSFKLYQPATDKGLPNKSTNSSNLIPCPLFNHKLFSNTFKGFSSSGDNFQNPNLFNLEMEQKMFKQFSKEHGATNASLMSNGINKD